MANWWVSELVKQENVKNEKLEIDEAGNRSNKTTRKPAIDKTANCHNYEMTKLENEYSPKIKNNKLIKRGIDK